MTKQPMELRAQFQHLIEGCRHVRDKRKGKHEGASAEAAYVAQEVTDQVLNLAIPLGYWERIAKAQATGGFVVPLEGDDRDLVMAYAAKEKISVDSACCQIFRAGYHQLKEAKK